jgi:hypothetical protein
MRAACVSPTNKDIVGTAGTGAMVALDAVGMQDTFLTGNDDSFFRFSNKRHTPLTKYPSARVMSNPGGSPSWPFGSVLKFSMNPRTMGDVLANMYLKFVVPPGSYCSQNLGWAMIHQLEFRVDSQVIEIIKGDWNVVYSQTHYLPEEQDALTQLFNAPTKTRPGNMYVPLHFFFNRRHGNQDTANPLIHDSYFNPYFLTCAAYANREITVSVTWNPATFFTSDGKCTLSSVTLVTEEFVISETEKAFIVGSKKSQVISFVGNNPVHRAHASPFHVNLTPSVPVKALYWFFRNTLYENAGQTRYYNDRYNFSNDILATNETETMSPIASETQLYLDGKQLMSLSLPTTNTDRLDGSFFYKFLQPLSHSLTVPVKNIYMYSFCLRPKDPAPSGAVDFSQLDSQSTKLTGSFYKNAGGNYSINVFYTGYHELTYENGFVSLKYAGV